MPALSLVYASDVVVFRTSEYKLIEQPFWVSVVAGALRSTSKAEICQKVDGVFRLACSKGHQSLVLGAWGCGAFGNDPADVSAAMADAARKWGPYFEHIVVALPKSRPEFVSAFPSAVIIQSRQCEVSAHVDVSIAKWDLLAALHVDTLATATEHFISAGEGGADLDGSALLGRWYTHISEVCVDQIAGLVDAATTARLGYILQYDSRIPDNKEASFEELALRAEFLRECIR